jgi:cell division protein FtsL
LCDISVRGIATFIIIIIIIIIVIIIIIIIIIITVESRQFEVNGTQGTPNYRKPQTIRVATI